MVEHFINVVAVNLQLSLGFLDIYSAFRLSEIKEETLTQRKITFWIRSSI